MSVNALANYLASLQQGEENHRTEIVYGEVMTVDPLSIRFGELNVTKPFLVPSKMYTPTEPGQKVMAIKTNGGQIYFVLHEKDFVVPDYYGLIEELEERLTKHTHDHITVPDNRNVVSVPSDLKGSTISADFKTNASAGSPPVTASDSYAHLINVAGYSSGEGSGGWPSQISVGDGLAIRQATGASSWGTWRKVAIESDIFDDSGSYRGLKSKSGGVSGYVRTPQGGLLPYAQSNDSYLGSSLWPFRGVYADTVYEGGTALVNKYAHTSQIGNLASLTTNHKSTLVGAVNEIQANNSLRQGGIEGIVLVNGSVVNKRVHFTKPYTAKPKIVLTAETGSPHRSHVSVTAIDLNGFDIRAWADWSGNMTVHWFAQP